MITYVSMLLREVQFNTITSIITVTGFCGINSFLDVNFLQMQKVKCCA